MDGTTPCSACRAPISNVVAGAPFCPFCGAQKPIRDLQSVTTDSQEGAATPASAEPVFTLFGADLCLTFDPRAGFGLLGGAAPEGQPGRLRLFDLAQRRVLWEALLGEPDAAKIRASTLSVWHGSVYVGLGRKLCVLDLLAGAEKWRAELSDDVASAPSEGGFHSARIIDSAPKNSPGVVWVLTVDNKLHAFDRGSGKPLWSEARASLPLRVVPIGAGLMLSQSEKALQLVDPATKRVLDSVKGRVERWDLDGTRALLQVGLWGMLERDGLLVHDFGTKKEVFFEPLKDLDREVPSIPADGRVFAALKVGGKLAAAPKSKTVALVPDFRIAALASCGPTLLALLRKSGGTSVRRLVGVDPATLEVRFDLGELAPRPTARWAEQLCSNGHVAVFVDGDPNDHQKGALIALDSRGRTLWRAPIGEWRAHYFLGGHLVVLSSHGWQVLRPETGQVYAAFSRR